MRLLKAALDAEDHNALMLTVMQQMAAIVPGCKAIKDPRYTAAVSVIVNELRNKTLVKETLAPQVAQLSLSLGMDKPEPSLWARDMFVQAMDEAAQAEAQAATTGEAAA